MYKQDLAFDNLQWLICHKTKANHIYLIYMYKEDLALNLAFNNLQWLICHQTKPINMKREEICQEAPNSSSLHLHGFKIPSL